MSFHNHGCDLLTPQPCTPCVTKCGYAALTQEMVVIQNYWTEYATTPIVRYFPYFLNNDFIIVPQSKRTQLWSGEHHRH